jgi:hypothetical protein
MTSPLGIRPDVPAEVAHRAPVLTSAVAPLVCAGQVTVGLGALLCWAPCSTTSVY